MNGHWQEFFGANSVQHTSESTNFICVLSDIRLVEVKGQDAAEFLQNQLTNDLNVLTQENFQISGYCTPKGRLLALFTVAQSAQGFYLMAPKDVMDAALDRLRKYVLMSQVEFIILDDWLHLGLCGSQASKYLAANNINLDPWQQGQLENTRILALPGPQARFHCFGPAGDLTKRLEHDNPPLKQTSEVSWCGQQILSGQPQVYGQSVELFIPQMLNLQVMNGLSFSKGCYPGQEIVARTQYRGTLKRHMHIAEIQEEREIPPGTDLWVRDAQFDRDEVAGNVVMSSRQPGKTLLLAVIQNQYQDHDIHCGENSGPSLKLLSLPYTLDAEN